jgi:MFS family permease
MLVLPEAGFAGREARRGTRVRHQKGARGGNPISPALESTRALLVLVGAIVFVDTMFFAALTPLLPHYSHELGLSKAGAGVLQAAYPIGTLVGAVPAGLVAARFGVKRTVVVGLTTLAGTSLVFGFAHQAWLLDVARFVQGASGSFSWTGALTWLVAAAPTSRRGELIGTALGVAIGGALFGPVLGGVASRAGTRPTFAVVAVLALVLAVLAVATRSAPERSAQPASALLDALRSPRVLAGVWFVMLPALLFGTLSVLAPLRLSLLGFGSLAIGATWLVSTGLEAAISPYVGRLSDRRGRRLPIVAGLAAAAAALAVLPWPDRDWLLAIFVVCAGISFGSFWAPAMSLLTDAAEDRGVRHGWAFTLMNLAWAPGQATGAAAGGAIAKATSDTAVYLALAGLCALNLAALWRPRSSS